jgi:hypothetical protein
MVPPAEQDQVVELGLSAAGVGDEVVCLELARGGTARVSAVPVALVQRAQLRIRRAAPDTRVHEIASTQRDREAARVAGEPLGSLDADRPAAFDEWRRVVADVHDHGRRAAPDPAIGGLACERDERVRGRLLPVQDRAGLLVERPLRLREAPDRLLEDEALLERQPARETQLAPPPVQFMLSARRR